MHGPGLVGAVPYRLADRGVEALTTGGAGLMLGQKGNGHARHHRCRVHEVAQQVVEGSLSL